jgi:hypothetical protein
MQAAFFFFVASTAQTYRRDMHSIPVDIYNIYTGLSLRMLCWLRSKKKAGKSENEAAQRNKTSKIFREYLKKKIKYGENTYFY